MRPIWTLRALKTYFKVSDYLQDEWGETVVKDFAEEVDRVLREIQDNPYMFKTSKKYKNVRKGFVTKHNTMFYRIRPRKKELEILLFWDNRRDDKKSPY